MTTHDKLIAKWSASEFGVKQRVFNDEMPQASVQYILKTPNYNDESKIKWLIERIEYHAGAVREEIKDMYNTIEGI